MSTIQIFLFGNFELLINGKKIDSQLWQSRQLRTILKLLVAKRGTPVPGSQIIEHIWPDKDPEIGNQHLYVRISQLRKILKSSGLHNIIQTCGQGYVFNADENHCWIDVEDFEKIADKGRKYLEIKDYNAAIQLFQKAAVIYRADYLIEDLYEDWTISERERLRDRYLVVLTEMAEAYAQTGRYRHAIDISRKILALDSYRESTFFRLMLYYYFLGEKAKSLEIFQQCKDFLYKEMAVLPDIALINLAKRIRSGELLGGRGTTFDYPTPVYTGQLYEVPYSLSETPFVGRDIEYSWLVHQFDTSEPSTVWIQGETGIGKTRLIEEFTKGYQKSNATVLKLQPNQKDSQPYALWISAFRQYPQIFNTDGLQTQTRETIAHLLSDENLTAEKYDDTKLSSHHHQIAEAIVDILLIKRTTQVILWVDDIHLVDPASLSIFPGLVGKFHLLFSAPTETENYSVKFNNFVNRYTREISSLHLSRWQKQDLEVFLEKLGAELLPELGTALYSITNGNPLFIISTLQQLFEAGMLFVNFEDQWEQTGDIKFEIQHSLGDMISLRLKKTTAEEKRILDVLAVAGGEIDYEILEDVLSLEIAFLINHTDKLINRGIVIEPRTIGTAELCFSHAIYQDVIYQTIPQPRKKSYHRSVAESMIKHGQNSLPYAGTLALHFSRAAVYDQAAHFSLLAGQYAAQLYAPQQAIPHFQNAIEWYAIQNETQNSDLLEQSNFGLAEALRLTGDHTQAIKHYRIALPLLKGEIKQAALYQIFQLQVLQGNPLTTYEELSQAAETSIAEEGLSWALPLLFWSQSFVYLLLGNPKETRNYNAKGWRVARQLVGQGKQPPGWICNRAYTLLMRAHNQWGNYRASIHFAQKNLSLVPTITQDANIKMVIKASLGESFYNLGDYPKAREYYQQCYKSASKADDLRLQGESLIGLGKIAFECGDLNLAMEKSKKVLALVEQKLDILRFTQAHFLQTNIALSQQNITSELQTIESIVQMARYQKSDPITAQALLLLAQLQAMLGQIDQAFTSASEARQISVSCGLQRELCQTLRILGQIKIKNGQVDQAFALVDESVRVADRIEAPFEKGLSLRVRSACQKDKNEVLKDLTQALSLFETIGAKFEHQSTRKLFPQNTSTSYENE